MTDRSLTEETLAMGKAPGTTFPKSAISGSLATTPVCSPCSRSLRGSLNLMGRKPPDQSRAWPFSKTAGLHSLPLCHRREG